MQSHIETPALRSAVIGGLGLADDASDETILAELAAFLRERRPTRRRVAAKKTQRTPLDRGRLLVLGARLSHLERKAELAADRAGERTDLSDDRALKALLEGAGLKPRVGRDGRLLRHESGSVKLDR